VIERWDQQVTGRRVAVAFAVMVSCLVAANVFSTLFYGWTGGYGILDFAGGRNAFDQRPGYTPDDAYALLAAWGSAGRRDHVVFTATGDVVLPLTAFAFGAAALWYGTRGSAVPGWARVMLLALPLAYLVSDYAENAAIVTMTLRYPTRLDQVAAAADWFRTVKSTTSTVVFLLALVASAVGFVRNRSTRSRVHNG
jgi:hypothetical protein